MTAAIFSRTLAGRARPGTARPPALAARVLTSGTAGKDWHAIAPYRVTGRRFDREEGEPLCKPGRRFPALSVPGAHKVTCGSCLRTAAHYGIPVRAGAPVPLRRRLRRAWRTAARIIRGEPGGPR